MKNNKRADTIAWIIIAVFILSFAMLWIVNVLDYNQNISDNYEKETDSYILKSNSENILKRLNIDHIEQDQKFWIYKNEGTNMYEVVTWTWNEMYRYIDKDGRKVDPATNLWKTFIREFKKKIDILRYDIKPPEINNLVFHFDATNIDWSDNSTLTNWQTISTWKNIAESWVANFVNKNTVNTWRTIQYSSNLPIYNETWINLKPMVEFNWVDQMMAIDSNWLLNNDRDWYANRVYMEKSFALVFKTSDDITNPQVIYEQWWAATWYNFYIQDGNVWAWVLNYGDSSYLETDYSWTDTNYYFVWDTWHKQKSVKLDEVRPNTIYFIMVVQDSTHLNRTTRPIIEDIKDKRYIDDQNRLKIYLNWVLANETDHVDAMPEHFYAWIWNVFAWSVTPAKTTLTLFDDIWASNKAYFKWWIWELISRNHALTENEIRGVQNYFSQKWLWGKASIRYDIVESTIKEFKEY